MLPGTVQKELSRRYAFRLSAAAVILMIFIFSGVNAGAALKQKGFATPEEAVKAFAAAIESNDEKELLSIFGTAGKELISSGDPVRDKQRRETFIGDYNRKNKLVQEGSRMSLNVGEKDWPFPVPLVKKGDQWFFDTKAGSLAGPVAREQRFTRRREELHVFGARLAGRARRTAEDAGGLHAREEHTVVARIARKKGAAHHSFGRQARHGRNGSTGPGRSPPRT